MEGLGLRCTALSKHIAIAESGKTGPYIMLKLDPHTSVHAVAQICGENKETGFPNVFELIGWYATNSKSTSFASYGFGQCLTSTNNVAESPDLSKHLCLIAGVDQQID